MSGYNGAVVAFRRWFLLYIRLHLSRQLNPTQNPRIRRSKPLYSSHIPVSLLSQFDEEILWEVPGQTAVEESHAQRRCGTQPKNIKRPYCGTSCKMVQQEEENTGGKNDNAHQAMRIIEEDMNDESLTDVELRYDVDCFQTKDSQYGNSDEDAGRGYTSDSGTTSTDTSFIANEGGDHQDSNLKASYNKWLTSCSSSSSAGGKSACATVKETIRTFNRFYLQLIQEERKVRRKEEGDIQGNSEVLKRKRENDSSEEHMKASRQLDLKALSKMYATNTIMYPMKRFGHLPGIDIGYQFHSRAEMVALGFHSDWLHGIDYMGKAYSEMEEYKDQTFPLAVAIVLSAEDEDNQHNSEDVIYTALCGQDYIVNQHQVKNPVTPYGNLALKNNMEQSIPIRVVRGHKSNSSFYDKVYTYDGLYKVIECWADKDLSGCLLYKTRLRRVEGQPKLTLNQVYFNKEGSMGIHCKSPGLVSMDISGGQEEVPIPLVNLIDDTPFSPTGFTYSNSIQVAESVELPPNADGCKCKGICTNPKSCGCAHLNGFKFPYVRHDGGRLTRARDVVFECGPNCGCGPDCINRISQRGIKYHLEVFRTPDKGWAVRTRDFIPSGAPVCEYVGVLRRTDELDDVDDNEYIFEIDCLHTIKGVEGRKRRLGAVSAPLRNHLEKIDDRYLEQTPEFCIDANSIGNVARFINHSCEPNLFVQCVLSAHQDARLARVVLFASESIAPFQEITYDYGCPLDSVIGRDGKVKQQPCYCGTAGCRKRLF